MKLALIGVVAAAVALTVGIVAAEQEDRVSVKPPFGKHTEKAPGTAATPQILWNGGPVLNQKTVPLYVVYYGSGFPSTTKDIVNKFLDGLGGKPQFNVNTTYCPFQTTNFTGHSPITAALSFSESTINLL